MDTAVLAIVIPTFNRAEILVENLEKMLPELNQFQIPVYIIDDSLDDKTETAIRTFREKYSPIIYKRNKPSLGHDKNCRESLFMTQADYVWYMGDSMYIKTGGIARVLGELDNRPSFIFVNSYAGDSLGRSAKIEALGPFLVRGSWYLTLSGATIYSKRVIDWCKANMHITIFNNFQQLAFILGYSASVRDTAYWIQDSLIDVNQKKRSYWRSNVLGVFTKDWYNLIKSFGAIFPQDHINHVLRSHSKNHKLYSLKNLLSYRAEGGFSNHEISKYKIWLELTSYRNIIFLRMITIIPVRLARLLKLIKSRFDLIKIMSLI